MSEMTDLQGHIDRWESWLASAHGCDIDHDTMQAILHVNEAARRWANPELEAMRRVNFQFCHNDYTDGQLRLLLAAALGITEDE